MSETSSITPRFCYNCGAGVVTGRRICLRCNTTMDQVPMRHTPPSGLPVNLLQAGSLVVDRYEVEEVESAGRLHVCYRAHDRLFQRSVTLRTLKASENNPNRLAELRRQARNQNALAHPHIVTTLDFVEDRAKGVVAIVEEYVGTRTLRDWLTQRTPLSLPFAAYRQLMLPITAAVAFAHRHGVVHRNLKPRKIFLDAFERPKVSDFGLTSYAPPQHSNSLPLLLGTLEYMAPEQAGNPLVIEPKADLYSLGVLFYELVSDQLPIEKNTNDLDFLNRLMNEPATPLVQCFPSVPSGLDAVIMRCLEKDPDDRYASADDLMLALADVLGAAPYSV
ncbi:MAG: hypothetical protein AUK47_01880 [Deltaproteobacteria bacterium CG2_30_63_29]|nr:MAG: hypothetical protein AUK47_01880 [Deltaproteobacteria bacterium CG2_30_63_29]PJB41958.1 MAG: hypothetical protein CO108_12335 [Deltaproteobacteria bacterium CG_4_9_14_3_um_filter_63_12]